MKRGVSPVVINVAFFTVIVVMVSVLVFGLFYFIGGSAEEPVSPIASSNNSNSSPNAPSIELPSTPVVVNYSDEIISSCGVLNLEKTNYRLSTDILISNELDTCFEITASDITLDLASHKIDGGNSLDTAISVSNVSNILIKNGVLLNVREAGISAFNISNLTTLNFLISSTKKGFVASSSSSLFLKDVSSILANEEAFYFDSVVNSTFASLLATNSSAGIALYDSSSNYFFNCTASYNSGTALRPISRSGFVVRDSDNNIFEDITAHHNIGTAQNGVYFRASDNNLINGLYSYQNSFSGLSLDGTLGDGSDYNVLNGSILLIDNQNVALHMRISFNNTLNGTFCGSRIGADIACEGGTGNNISGVYDTLKTTCADLNNTIADSLSPC